MEEETRVGRYKEYRQSFIKEGAISTEEQDGEVKSDFGATTSTLPMGEVLHAVQAENDKVIFSNHARRNHIIKIIVEISIVVLVVAGLVVLGIFAWRK